jgi:hypothetical protein
MSRVFVKTMSSGQIFSSAVSCTIVVLWFFKTILHIVWR